MCGRYVLTQDHAKALLAQLGVILNSAASRRLQPSRYNLPPGGPILAVRSRPAPAQAAPPRELAWLQWGLVPAWAGADTRPVTNARAESLVDKPTFRSAYQTRRCLIPASGFYEWQNLGRTRRPWLFRLRDEQPFAFAGLWATYRAADGQILESCALITTAANALMQPVHHRMPALLVEPAAWSAWLDPRITSADTLAPLLRPLPADALTATPVSVRVNQTRNDDPACLEPATAGDDNLAATPSDDDAPQLTLGL